MTSLIAGIEFSAAVQRLSISLLLYNEPYFEAITLAHYVENVLIVNVQNYPLSLRVFKELNALQVDNK